MMKVKRELSSAAVLFFICLALAACSSAPVQKGDKLIEPKFPSEKILPEDATYLSDQIADPMEGFNRTIYRFNYRFDRYLFLPVVSAYQTILPDFAQQGVHNFFNNIREITTLINSILQLSFKKTYQTTGRFVFNTTFGLLGLFDVATVAEIPRHQEDFGQTLGYWGVGNGPFLVLPILGPSNLRDGVGLAVDTLTMREIRNWVLDLETWQEWTWLLTDAVDTRANVAFRYYETGSPFEYEWVRLLYTTKRQIDIKK